MFAGPIGVLDDDDPTLGRDGRSRCLQQPPPRRVAVVYDGRESTYADVADLDQLPDHQLREISHFFDIYRDLDPDKDVSSDGQDGAAVAIQLLDQ